MLPLPGVMVRASRFKTLGISYKDGLFLSVLVAFLWVGSAFIYAGACALFINHLWLGFFLFGAGAPVLFGSAGLIHYLYKNIRYVLSLIAVRCLITLTEAGRLFFCFAALHVGADFVHSSILSVAPAVGAMVVIVPSGLGIIEAVSALLGGVLDVGASASYMASTLSRILWLIVNLFLGIFVFVAIKVSKKPT